MNGVLIEGILKRRGAENAEEVFQKELCGLCDSAFPICKTPVAPNQPINLRNLVQKYEYPIRGNTFVDLDSQGLHRPTPPGSASKRKLKEPERGALSSPRNQNWETTNIVNF